MHFELSLSLSFQSSNSCLLAEELRTERVSSSAVDTEEQIILMIYFREHLKKVHTHAGTHTGNYNYRNMIRILSPKYSVSSVWMCIYVYH